MVKLSGNIESVDRWGKLFIVLDDMDKIRNYLMHCKGRLPVYKFKIKVSIPAKYNGMLRPGDFIDFTVRKKQYSFNKDEVLYEGWSLHLIDYTLL